MHNHSASVVYLRERANVLAYSWLQLSSTIRNSPVPIGPSLHMIMLGLRYYLQVTSDNGLYARASPTFAYKYSSYLVNQQSHTVLETFSGSVACFSDLNFYSLQIDGNKIIPEAKTSIRALQKCSVALIPIVE